MKIRITLSTCLLTAMVATFSSPLAQQPLQAQPSSTYDVQVVSNVIYYSGPGFNPTKHILDIYKPRGLSNVPVLMFVHGGGWQDGDKSLYSYLGRTFASRGFTTVVISYRLTPEVMHPGHIQDVARAFAWIYRNISQQGGDPERIFITGHSAGGHLVALLALDERYLQGEGLSTDLIRGAMPISGVYDITAIPGFESVFGSDPEARRDASPLAHVDEKQPPFLISYAQFDFPTLGDQARELARLLQEHSTPVELLEAPRKDHITIVGQIGLPGDLTTQALLDFMQAHLESH